MFHTRLYIAAMRQIDKERVLGRKKEEGSRMYRENELEWRKGEIAAVRQIRQTDKKRVMGRQGGRQGMYRENELEGREILAMRQIDREAEKEGVMRWEEGMNLQRE